MDNTKEICFCHGPADPHWVGSLCKSAIDVSTMDVEDPLRPKLKPIGDMTRAELINEIVTANMSVLENMDTRAIKLNLLDLRMRLYNKALVDGAGLGDDDGHPGYVTIERS